MDFDGGRGTHPDAELVSLRREVATLRHRVAELSRSGARHRDDEQVQHQGGLDALAARQELMLEAERVAHVGSWVWDVETNNVFWSNEMFRIFGYDPDTDPATSEAFFSRVHHDDREHIRELSEASIRTGVSRQTEYRVVHPDGSQRDVVMDASLLFDESGKLRRVVGAVRDLTEERALQKELRRALELLEQAQAIAQLGNFAFTLRTAKCEWSPGFYRVLGIDPSTPASIELFMTAVHPEDRDAFVELQKKSMLGQWHEELEVRLVRPNGELRQALLRSIALLDAAGAVTEYRGTLLDVTDQVVLTRRLAQIGKMDAVGRLAGGIAHDFNNLLTVIGANLELWAEASGTEGEIHDARRALRSARSLTERLLAFGRKAQLTKRIVDPNELVSRTVDLVRRVLGDRVRVELELARTLPAICVDPALIEQALINLVINARDAMPGGGTVTLRTRLLDAAGKKLVEIEVGDDGPGMDPSVKAQIFEPFFTTKGDLGTGLGLPTVLGTVEQHGGSVEVDSEKGKGARFRLRLPVEPTSRAESLAPEPRRPEVSHMGREILVIEDEPLVAAVIARSLERKSHTVLLAHRPAEAVRLWGEHPNVALVICDVSMGEMRGPEIVRELRKAGRKVPVLYVTGYAEDGVSDILGEPMLPKPFTPNELVRAVSELLSS